MLKINNYVLKGKHNFSIAHFSDIHYSYKFSEDKLNAIINEINKLKPSYICITGDLVDNIKITINKELIMKFYQFIRDLSNMSKLIIGLGNHDLRKYKNLYHNHWYLELKKIPNVIVLNNEEYVDNNICFYGFTPSDKYYENETANGKILQQEMKKINIKKQQYNVLLMHTPFHLNEEEFHNEIKDFNLILCGHTHNGLVPHCIGGNFGFITPNKKIFVKNARKSFNNREITIIISGGITKLSYGTGFLYKFNRFYKGDINYITIKNE